MHHKKGRRTDTVRRPRGSNGIGLLVGETPGVLPVVDSTSLQDGSGAGLAPWAEPIPEHRMGFSAMVHLFERADGRLRRDSHRARGCGKSDAGNSVFILLSRHQALLVGENERIKKPNMPEQVRFFIH